jgi:hypothetical protein
LLKSVCRDIRSPIPSQIHLLHHLLILLFQVAIERDVQIHGQRLPPSMASDKLQLGIGQARADESAT